MTEKDQGMTQKDPSSAPDYRKRVFRRFSRKKLYYEQNYTILESFLRPYMIPILQRTHR